MPYILDSAVFMSGASIPMDDELVTSDDVVAELRDLKSNAKLEELKALGLRIVGPSAKAIAIIKKAAKKTGDDAVLSHADINLLALAQELSGVLITDDYAIQNVAQSLAIRYQCVAQRGITEKRTWIFRCSGCRRIWTKRYDECPVCGSALRRVSVEKKKPKQNQKYNNLNIGNADERNTISADKTKDG